MAQNGKRPLKIIAGADPLGFTLKDALVGRRVSSEANSTTTETRGLVACGTGVGVAIFANKFPGVYSATSTTIDDAVNSRSINNCNVLAVSGASTSPNLGIKILETWLNTPFKSPCPASGNNPWSPDLQSFLDESIGEMSKIGLEKKEEELGNCSKWRLAKNREFTEIDIMPGGMMKIVRESPTSAIVTFKGGSIEPAHHHTFGHDVVVMRGKKCSFGVGDYLFTPAGDVHRVEYLEDTEFFIKWDGHWDIFLDEDLDLAKCAIQKDEF
ncbi:hypothetical protein MKX01_025534 [Papaver californicum]|nr:hypothetical protein MKX01_025534 [Papaver californicum]